MPISTLPNRRAFHFDKQMELRDGTASAVAATTSETAIAFTAVAFDVFKVIVYPTAFSAYVAGSAEWTISVEAGLTLGGAFTVIDSVKPNGTTPKTLEMALSGGEIEQAVPGAKYLRVTATKTGTPGSLIYGAFVSPEVH
jgi:hypothetical protein